MEISNKDIISFKESLENKINNNLFIDHIYNLTGNIIAALLYLESDKMYYFNANFVPEKSIHFKNISNLLHKFINNIDTEAYYQIHKLYYITEYVISYKEGNIRNKLGCKEAIEFLNSIPEEISNEIIKEYFLFKINIEKYMDRIKGKKKV